MASLFEVMDLWGVHSLRAGTPLWRPLADRPDALHVLRHFGAARRHGAARTAGQHPLTPPPRFPFLCPRFAASHPSALARLAAAVWSRAAARGRPQRGALLARGGMGRHHRGSPGQAPLLRDSEGYV